MNGSVPGDIGEMLLVKDSTTEDKRVQNPPFPTYFSENGNFEIPSNSAEDMPYVVENGEIFAKRLFR